MDLQVFIFTWNTQTVRYNIGDGPDADFVNVLSDKIINSDRNYDLVVIGLQEDAIRDSPLLADDSSIIVNSLEKKYQLIKLVTLNGWGITTYKALKEEWDYRPRGLRLAIFKRHDLELDITDVESKEMVCPGIRDWITAGKGGVAVSIHTSVGKIAFLNIHLPFSSRSIIQDPVQKISRRHDAVMWQANCLRKLYENTVNTFNPDYIFVLGDLNFRVQIRTESGAAEITQRIFEDPDYIKELIKEADELQLLLDYSRYGGVLANPEDSPPEEQSPDKGSSPAGAKPHTVYARGSSSAGAKPRIAEESADGSPPYEQGTTKQPAPVPILNEGVNNSGPLFLPTCKLRQGRDDVQCGIDSYRLGQEDQRTPSWCDRILFKQLDGCRGELSCILYDRWDYGTMNLSDHASVVGVYCITGRQI